MRTSRFYINDKLAEGKLIDLSADTAKYIFKVLRHKTGDAAIFFDGQGNEFEARLASSTPPQAHLEKRINNHRESPLYTHLIQAIGKGDKLELVLQKATELGVNEITPVFTERAQSSLKGTRLAKKTARWQSIVINACEQSGRTVIPTINPPTTLIEALQATQASDGIKIALSPTGESRLSNIPSASTLHIVIGPEGGLSNTELETCASCHFQAISLGKRILRTETTPLTILSIAQFMWGDLG